MLGFESRHLLWRIALKFCVQKETIDAVWDTPVWIADSAETGLIVGDVGMIFKNDSRNLQQSGWLSCGFVVVE
eukprot:1856123-Ditylum_brightwellii.AAC.1